MLILNDVTKSYQGTRVLNDLSFSASAGKIVGFLGPNGAGKTTTMRIMSGESYPSSGSVTFEGQSVHDMGEDIKKDFGYLPERVPLYEELTVTESLSFYGALYGVEDQTLSVRREQLLEQLGLGVFRHQQVKFLSKGYRQRLGLAQVLSHDPKVLLLDEPMNGLDPQQSYEFKQLLSSLKKDKIIILSTHLIGDIENLCDQYVIIKKGQKVADGDVHELEQKKDHAERMNQFLITVEGDRGSFEKALSEVAVLKEDDGKNQSYVIETDLPGNEVLALVLQSHVDVISFERRKKNLMKLFLGAIESSKELS